MTTQRADKLPIGTHLPPTPNNAPFCLCAEPCLEGVPCPDYPAQWVVRCPRCERKKWSSNRDRPAPCLDCQRAEGTFVGGYE